MIVGIVGPFGAGKSSVVDYLVSKGFNFFRLSDVIKEELKLANPDRKSLQDAGNKLRQEFGRDYLARKIWEKVKQSPDKNVVVDGLRNQAEVEFFRKSRFYLICIEAHRKTRYQRLKGRSLRKDPKDWEEFLKMEGRDLGEDKDFGQQTKATMGMADLIIENNGTISKLHEKIDKVLKKIL